MKYLKKNSIHLGNLFHFFFFFNLRFLRFYATVEQVLKIVRNFYIEPLKPENMEKAFEDNEEWKECIIEQYNGNVNDIINLDVFSVINDCAPDFCGLSFDEKSSEYFVGIGPE